MRTTYRKTLAALLGTASLVGAMAVATPAMAREVTYNCSLGIVTGDTTRVGGITFLSSSNGECGRLNVRTYYNFAGGGSFTPWRKGTVFNARADVSNANYSEHLTDFRPSTFRSVR